MCPVGEMIETENYRFGYGDYGWIRYPEKRYKPRTITVGYQLIAKSNTEFWNAYK